VVEHFAKRRALLGSKVVVVKVVAKVIVARSDEVERLPQGQSCWLIARRRGGLPAGASLHTGRGHTRLAA
jgi:hypothetical protein